MVQFGRETAKPFTDYRTILAELIVSARSLAQLWAQQQRPFRTEEQEKRHCDRIEKDMTVFWEGLPEEDPIVSRVDACIQEIEAICRPILADQQTIIRNVVNSFLDKAKKKNANKRLHEDRS